MEVKKIEGNEYAKNARGDWIPLAKVKVIDKIRDELVLDIVKEAREHSEKMKKMKAMLFDSFDSFLALSYQEHGIRYGGQKGNVSLTTYDGQWKVMVVMQDVLEFDERLQVAKELVDKCINKWSSGANDNLRILVNDAFQVDKKGRLNTKRILELRRYEIDDEDWKEAMEAISASLKVVMSRRYIRIYQQLGNEQYEQLPMDFSSV